MEEEGTKSHGSPQAQKGWLSIVRIGVRVRGNKMNKDWWQRKIGGDHKSVNQKQETTDEHVGRLAAS